MERWVRKLLALLFVGLVAIGALACGGDGDEEEDEDEDSMRIVSFPQY
jgi:hypothetical protein